MDIENVQFGIFGPSKAGQESTATAGCNGVCRLLNESHPVISSCMAPVSAGTVSTTREPS